MPTVEFAILGAGALGSIVGAHLVRAGHSVVVLARGRRAEQIEREGLRIKGLVELATPVQVITDPTRLRSAEVLIVATKAIGTAASLEPLRQADIGLAFSVQNGVMKNELLAGAFGRDRVLGALANTSGELLPTGEVLFTRNVNLLVGELSGGMSERASRVAAAIDASGVRSTAVPDIEIQEWSKFTGWIGLMALSVTTRASTWKYLTDPGSALLLARLVREAGQLAAASGVTLTDETILPVATLCRATEPEAVDIILKLGEDYRANAPAHRMSTLQDLDAGRPLELEETVGFAVRKAAELGLSLPLLENIHHLLGAIDRMRG